MSTGLSRSQRLAVIDRAIDVGDRFLRENDPQGHSRNTWEERHAGAATWKASALSAVNGITPASPWAVFFDTIEAEPTLLRIRQSVFALRMLRWRIADRRPESLDDEIVSKLSTATMLVTFGDFVIDTAEDEHQQGFTGDFHNAIAAFEATLLPVALGNCARWAAEDAARSSSWMRSIEIIRGNVDSDTKILQIDRAPQWRVGWALLTLGWQIADSTEDTISVGGLRLCPIGSAIKARAELLKHRRVSCSHCGEATKLLTDVDKLSEGGMVSCLFLCKACEISTYFPLSARPESVWGQPDPVAADAPFASPVPTLGSALKLGWMRDPVLREIAEGDMREVDSCIAVGAWKAALLLSGSACETMLLEVLERNARISASYMRKAEQFPDKTSLDDMIRAAEAEKLIKSLALTIAPALRAYRDLIHPNRARQATFTVSENSVLAIAHSVRVIAEELEAAHVDGRLAAFLSK